MTSKFLKYQDVSGTNINDTCDELVDVPGVPTCLACKPNPSYIMPSWKETPAAKSHPWLNEKICKYQVAIATTYTSLIPHAGATDAEAESHMSAIFEVYVEDAIESLLLNFKKADTIAARATLREIIEYENFDLDARAISYVKLLYQVPLEEFNALASQAEEEDDNDDDDDLGAGPITVNYDGEKLNHTMLQVRKSLHLYSRYLSSFRGIPGGSGNVIFVADERLFPLKRYGDNGYKSFGTLQKIQKHIEDFLSNQGLYLRGGPLTRLRGDRITSITFTFSEEYKLIKISALTEGCGAKPFNFGPKKLKPLTSISELKDKTAMAYFARAKQMKKDLTRREPLPWLEFLIKHTFPKIKETFNWPLPTAVASETSKSCMGEALHTKGVQLGQDLLDDAFSIADSFAYLFREGNCKTSVAEYDKELIRFGTIPDPTGEHPFADLLGIAKEQAYKELEADDAVFVQFCTDIIISGNFGKGTDDAASVLDTIFPEAFDRLKACGLAEFLLDAVKCLMNNLTFEEAIARVLNAALQNMSIEDLGFLFIGLPPDKQSEISALVQQKIDSGDVFKDGGSNAQLSALIEQGADRTQIQNIPPWSGAGASLVSGTTAKDLATGTFSKARPEPEGQRDLPGERRTIAQQFDTGNSNANAKLNSGVVTQLYIQSLLEVHSDNLLDVMDGLNKFPGAPLVAQVLMYMDCPTSPIFEPSYLDFIADIELPWCKNGNDITMPKLQNPFGWIPDWKDLRGVAMDAFKLAIQQAIVNALTRLVVKICSLLGGSMCKIAAAAGEIGFNAIEANNRSSISDTIADAICGGDRGSVNDTIVDMFDKLGVGAAALANTEDVVNFMGDVSSLLTRSEMMGAFLGDLPDDAAGIINDLKENEYPQFSEGLPDKDSLRGLFGNMGNLFPESLKSDMRNFRDSLEEGDLLPANPSLCATPESVEDFCTYRKALLSGRSTPDQAAQLCDNYYNDMLDDLGSLADALHGDPMGTLPPLVSDPGCDNGLTPFESPEAQIATSQALSSNLKQLLTAFSEDMLGNGPNEKRWGLINMILSDTQGTPLTAHYRKSYNSRSYVDFINPLSPLSEEGQFPKYVAEWLRDYILELEIDFVSNNDYTPPRPIIKTFEQLGIRPIGGVEVISLPDFGYDTSLRVDMSTQEVLFIRGLRKKNPDISLGFTDNNKGLTDLGSTWSNGFDIDLFLSELSAEVNATTSTDDDHKHVYYVEEHGTGRTSFVDGHSHKIIDNVVQEAGTTPHTHTLLNNASVTNIKSDNARVNITNLLNQDAMILPTSLSDVVGAVGLDVDGLAIDTASLDNMMGILGIGSDPDENIMKERSYEFLAVDDTFRDLNFNDYPEFQRCFLTKQANIPQVVLLTEILNKNGIEITRGEVKTIHDNIMSSLFKDVADKVANNEFAWEYGAEYDTLTADDAKYVVSANQTDSPEDTLYGKAEINGEKLTNDNGILGVSRDQLKNGADARVIYLEPPQFGGNYVNPPVYIKPLKNNGWLGLIDVLFPEFSPCASKTDLINLKQIEDEIASSYNSIPEDDRLKENDDCIVELPYARILERASKAGIQGLIKATCRIYVSVHLIKSMATFTKFAPKFEDVCSSIYSQFIVEDMEKSLKDSQGAFWEFFNNFKDEEFWYAFLEQAVQTYGRLVDDGTIVKPPMHVLNALFAINDMQEAYQYPTREEFKLARFSPGAAVRAATYKNYREEKNYNAIKETEDHAKVILNEMVKTELNAMGETLIDNLKDLDIEPEFNNMDYYLLTELSQGGIGLDLNKEIKEEVDEDIPTDGNDFYTTGGQFSTAIDGEEYIGYFHAHDDDNGPVYMTGAYHTDDSRDLNIYANKVIVPIGDIEDVGYEATYSATKPFVLEKYISINEMRFANDEAIALIKARDNRLNISDVYPGTLRLVYMSEATGEIVEESEDTIVGLTGKLGIRYGLSFSAVDPDGNKKELISVEIDPLDRSIEQFGPLEGDSKQLLCLIRKLVEAEEFKMISRYIVPSNKAVALTAIYNDLGFLSSIGEKTTALGASLGPSLLTGPLKPGMSVKVADDGSATYSWNDGWASAVDRIPKPGLTPFVVLWDEWDQVLLRNSKSRLKKLFKTYYNSRNFDIHRALDSVDPVKFTMKNLKSRLKPASGKRIIPRWSRKRIVGNPFDAKGNLCEK
jgi:hypothetical protein